MIAEDKIWKVLWGVVLAGLLIAGVAHAEVREIVVTGVYVMGDGETMSVAEERARMNAARQAAEEAGAFVRSYSRVLNMVLEEDVVEVIANHAMKITVLSKNRELVGDAVRFTVKIKAEISNADIDANLKRAAEERRTVADYRQLKEAFESQGRMLAALKHELAAAPAERKKEILGKIGENENQFRAGIFLEEGLRKLSALDNSGADAALTKAIELNPKLAQAYAARAEARLWYAATPDLVADANHAIRLEPNNARYYAVRARIIAFNNCSEQKPQGCREAIADIEKAKSLDPADPAYPSMLGALYASLNQNDLAAKEYDRAVRMLPSVLLPIAAVNTYIARADFTLKAAGQDYLKQALHDLDRAVAMISSPLYMTEEAKKFAQLFKRNPQSEQEAFRLAKDIFGMDLAKMGNAERKAFLARADKASQILNNAALVHWKRAQVLYEAGDVKAAEKDRSEACELGSQRGSLVDVSGIVVAADACTAKGIFPPFPSEKALAAYQAFMRGQRLFGQSKYAAAIIQFSHALELDPKLFRAYIQRGMSYAFSSPSAFEKAIADLTAAIRLDPKNGQALYERGLAYWAQSNDRAWNGDLQGAKQDRIKAGEDFTATVNLADNDYRGLALVQRGKVFETQEQYDLAAKDYDAAARLGGVFHIFLDKARVWERAGKNAQAMAALDEFLSAARKELAEKGEAGDSSLAKKISEAEAKKKDLR